MRVKAFHVELHCLYGGERRHVATYAVPRARGCFRRLTKVLEDAQRTFDGFVAITVFPMFADETVVGAPQGAGEDTNGQGMQAQAADGAAQSGGAVVGAELGPAQSGAGGVADRAVQGPDVPAVLPAGSAEGD